MNLLSSPAVWILIVLALVAVVTFFERFFDLRRAQIDYEDFLKGIVNILDHGGKDEALAICEETPSPVASVVATAIRNRRSSARLLREAVDSQGRAEVGRLDRRLAVLAIIAQVAPLLGLLGTIYEFVNTVRLSFASAVVTRTALFDGTISALGAAAFGIAVAILAHVTYSFLRVRLERIIVDLEASASQIIGYISAQKEKEALREKDEAKEKAK